MNVMNLIKKGPKKLRGMAAVLAKKRLDAPVAKRKIIDKRNPLKSFAQLSDGEMYEEMNNYIQNLSPIRDRDLIKMFNILTNGIPWPLVKSFFIEFDESNSNNIVNFFGQFYKRPEIKTRVELMKKILYQRRASPVTNKLPDRPNIVGQQQLYIRPPILPYALNPEIKKHYIPAGIFDIFDLKDDDVDNRTFFGTEFPSKCEQEYRRAPWMYKFTKEPIRGFALRNEIPEYHGVNPLITTELISTPFEGTWYKASLKWYKEVCQNGRSFNDGNVAYLTASGNLIIETKEMFDISTKDWEHIIDIEFSHINEHSFDVAKTILNDNPILSNYSSKDIDAILASIANNTNINYDMAKRLSWLLVFLSKITKEPQIYHYRVQNHQYKPEDLILLDRYALLPEIYKNPNADSDEVEYLIKTRRRFIENQFYSRLQPIEIGKRKRTVPLKPEIFNYLTTNSYLKCPPGVQDIVYYEEDGRLYCFNRTEIKNMKNNPTTGKPFHLEFLHELSRISSPKITLKQEGPQDIIREAQPEIDLAPGLFQKLKEEIELITPIYCSMCNKEIFAPKYKSIKGSQKVHFCEKECFDQFRF